MTSVDDQRTDTAAGSGALTVTVRYWAGARDAAGLAEETVGARGTVDDLLADLVAAHPALAGVAPVCSVLVDGVASDRESDLRATAEAAGRAGEGADGASAGTIVEILPPFAGG